MAFTHFIQTAQDFIDFGMSAQGSFVGSTDGTTAGSGFDPLYFVNSEESAGQIAWKSTNRAGANALLLGDGAGSTKSEIVFECSIRNNDDTATGWAFAIGKNSAVTGSLNLRISSDGFASFMFGTGASSGVRADFDAGGTVAELLRDGSFHRVRFSCIQDTAGTFAIADTMIITIDDVVRSEDARNLFIDVTSDWDGSAEHYLSLGGLDNNNSGAFSIGDVFISSDHTGTTNTAPTGSYNSVLQRS